MDMLIRLIQPFGNVYIYIKICCTMNIHNFCQLKIIEIGKKNFSLTEFSSESIWTQILFGEKCLNCKYDFLMVIAVLHFSYCMLVCTFLRHWYILSKLNLCLCRIGHKIPFLPFWYLQGMKDMSYFIPDIGYFCLLFLCQSA